jgi:NAD(P)-dependent dehydrogenase (short-subunit alcohol dehydrogenase family)
LPRKAVKKGAIVDLAGKRAVVLGGTSGIGLATVQRLLAAGVEVTAGGRSEQNIASAAEAAPGATFRAIDVLDRDGMEALFSDCASFDVLVNAATGGERAVGPFLNMDPDGFQGSFDKLWGYVNSVRFGAHHMSEAGSIVLVSGSPARKCQPGMSSISSVGNAVEGFIRAIAPELAPRRINVVSPGIIDTPMFPVQGDDRSKFLDQATANNLIKRAGTPDEVADAVMFLLGNDFVTGTTVDVDGGALLP